MPIGSCGHGFRAPVDHWKGGTVMAKALIFRTKPQRLDLERFSKIARQLGINKKAIETDEAMAAYDSVRALAYAQPGAKFGGLLYYTDQSVSLGEIVKKPVDPAAAKNWSDGFLKDFKLLPKAPGDKRIAFRLGTKGVSGSAFLFDGKRRKEQKVNTEVISRISLNGITAGGPRAKIRIVFKEKEPPLMMHCGIWGEIEVYEERELVEKEDVMKVVKEKLSSRSNSKSSFQVSDIRLSYFAKEYEGGPDLLAPYYFVDVEFEDRQSQKLGISQGPRQMFWIPAYR
jgi:hypothetical protein